MWDRMDHEDLRGIKRLLSLGAPPDARAPDGMQGLLALVARGNQACAQAVIEAGGDPLKESPRGGSPLRFALDLQGAGMMRLIIQACAREGRERALLIKSVAVFARLRRERLDAGSPFLNPHAVIELLSYFDSQGLWDPYFDRTARACIALHHELPSILHLSEEGEAEAFAKLGLWLGARAERLALSEALGRGARAKAARSL